MAYSHTNSKGTTYYLQHQWQDVLLLERIKEGALDAVPAGKVVVEMKTGMLVLEECPS